MVELPVPSAAPSFEASDWALVRVPESVSSAPCRESVIEEAVPEIVASESRACWTVARASDMVPCASDRSLESPVSSSLMSWRSVATPRVAESMSPAALLVAVWSFSVTVLPTTFTNWLAIWVSSVVAPVSVTFGATAFAFSFT